MEEVKRKIITAPNFITGVGIILVCMYIVSFATNMYTIWIPVLIFYAGLSDVLDGWVARKFNQHSYIGKILDPLRDRFLAAAIFVNIIMIADNDFPSYAFLFLILVYELGIGLVNYFRNKRVQDGGKVHLVGKLRMLVHTACGGIFVLKTYWVDQLLLFGEPGYWILRIDTFILIHIMFIASFITFFVYLSMSGEGNNKTSKK